MWFNCYLLTLDTFYWFWIELFLGFGDIVVITKDIIQIILFFIFVFFLLARYLLLYRKLIIKAVLWCLASFSEIVALRGSYFLLLVVSLRETFLWIYLKATFIIFLFHIIILCIFLFLTFNTLFVLTALVFCLWSFSDRRFLLGSFSFSEFFFNNLIVNRLHHFNLIPPMSIHKNHKIKRDFIIILLLAPRLWYPS